MKQCRKCGNEFSKGRGGRCNKCDYTASQASKYGVTFEAMRQMREQENCDCCTLPLDGDRNRHIDHCHTSGFIRGVLCRSCNIMLGYAKDNPQRLLNGIKYLESHYSHWDSVLKYEME